GSVEGFVRDNRDALAKDVRQLTTVMSTIASEKQSLDKALRIAPLAMSNLHLGFDHWSGAQNARVAIGANVLSADSLICGIIQQNPGMPRALKNTACTLIRQLLRPVLDRLGWLPPRYDQYVPAPAADTRDGFRVREPVPVTVATVEDPTMADLLGGRP
ncbi:MAG TPA: hypothetical protein VD859_15485, partial [Nocardioides sp.]|nr:hypothetical protein [Nocardioides sp.]